MVPPPRERKVFLQTMRRRPRKGKSIAPAITPATKANPTLAELAEQISDRDSTRATESPHDSAMNLGNPMARPDVENLPPSLVPGDVQSEVSGESAISNNSATYSGRGADVSGESTTGSRHSGHDDREITATVELLKGGCLPGDLVPVRIKVEHNRYMKSLHGIIVTLYRQGRVDYSPPISSFTGLSKEDATRLERDDYYPRSKTGLGGLSLSSAGSCSVFRKDLSQAVAPLIVDPGTLTATINTAVRVPEDAFPSIRHVPGGLITFKYHIEVIVDLGGRLVGPSSGASQSQHPNLIVSSAAVRGTYGIDVNLLANWNSTIIDTDHIRREKGVISVSFEIVVGTTDSSRTRGKAVVRPSPTAQAPAQDEDPREEEAYDYPWPTSYNGDMGDQEEYNGNGFQQPQPQFYSPVTSPQTAHYDFLPHETQAPIYVPPPEVAEEGNLTDKERARRAEQRLLPSQPSLQRPETEAGPSQPSGSDQTPYLAAHASSPATLAAGSSTGDGVGEEPSAPTLGDLGANPSEYRTEDKQELERRRLLAEASAPPNIPDDYDAAESSAPILNRTTSLRWSHEPSAPTLNENHEDEAGNHYRNMMQTPNTPGSSEPLPRYER